MSKCKLFNKLKKVEVATVTALMLVFSSAAYADNLPSFSQAAQDGTGGSSSGENYTGQALSPTGVGSMFTKFKRKVSSAVTKLSQKQAFAGKSFFIEYEKPTFPSLWPQKPPASFVNAPAPLGICLLSMPYDNFVFQVGENRVPYGFYPDYPDKVAANTASVVRPDFQDYPSQVKAPLTAQEWRTIYRDTIIQAKQFSENNYGDTGSYVTPTQAEKERKDIEEMEKCVSDQTKVAWLLDKEKELFGKEGIKAIEMALINKGFNVSHTRSESNYTLKVHADNTIEVLDKEGNTVFMN